MQPSWLALSSPTLTNSLPSSSKIASLTSAGGNKIRCNKTDRQTDSQTDGQTGGWPAGRPADLVLGVVSQQRQFLSANGDEPKGESGRRSLGGVGETERRPRNGKEKKEREKETRPWP